MRRAKIYIILLIVFLIIALLAYQYIFNVYEVDFRIEPAALYADNVSTLTMKTIPVNSLGWEAPFRKASAKFEIKEGADLIEIIKKDEEEGVLILKAKNITGKVLVFIKPELSLLPSLIEIQIYPNTA